MATDIVRIGRALLSVSDKTGLLDLAHALKPFGVEKSLPQWLENWHGDGIIAAVKDRAVLDVAAKVRYVVDPKNPYPDNFTGHIRAVMADGRVIEERQPHMRGGAHEPLSPQDIADKFALCARHGGWEAPRIEQALKLARGLYDGKIDLAALRG